MPCAMFSRILILVCASTFALVPFAANAQITPSYTYIITANPLGTGPCTSPNPNPVFPSAPYCSTGLINGSTAPSCPSISSSRMNFSGNAYQIPSFSPATYISGQSSIGGPSQPVVWQTVTISGTTSVEYWLSGVQPLQNVSVNLVCW